MNSAPVGFQCPNCLAAGRASVRQARTLVGGRVPRGDYVTLGLIGINTAIYLLGLISGSADDVALRFGMWPIGIALQDEWGRLITAAFLHGGLLHLAFNMYVLYLLGPALERALGHIRFAAVYLVAALGGSVASYVFSPANTLSVGASGAIFGLMAAFLVVGNRYRNDVSQIAVLLAVNVGIGFIVPGIDWRAHLGGAVAGAAVAAVLAYAPRQNRAAWQLGGVVAIVGILAAAAMIRTDQIVASAEQLLG